MKFFPQFRSNDVNRFVFDKLEMAQARDFEGGDTPPDVDPTPELTAERQDLMYNVGDTVTMPRHTRFPINYNVSVPTPLAGPPMAPPPPAPPAPPREMPGKIPPWEIGPIKVTRSEADKAYSRILDSLRTRLIDAGALEDLGANDPINNAVVYFWSFKASLQDIGELSEIFEEMAHTAETDMDSYRSNQSDYIARINAIADRVREYEQPKTPTMQEVERPSMPTPPTAPPTTLPTPSVPPSPSSTPPAKNIPPGSNTPPPTIPTTPPAPNPPRIFPTKIAAPPFGYDLFFPTPDVPANPGKTPPPGEPTEPTPPPAPPMTPPPTTPPSPGPKLPPATPPAPNISAPPSATPSPIVPPSGF